MLECHRQKSRVYGNQGLEKRRDIGQVDYSSDNGCSTDASMGLCTLFTSHFLSENGATLAMTLPLINASGNGPYILESRDSSRLSPRSQQCPSGTYIPKITISTLSHIRVGLRWEDAIAVSF